MTFEHYIITRFNLPIFQAKVAGKESTSCSKEYLQYRFELFEKYCMPSIMNQTCQNFKWLVLFDINTPDEFKQRITKLHNKYPNLVHCFLDINKYKNVPDEYIKLCEHYTETIKTHYPTKNYDLKNDDLVILISDGVTDYISETKLQKVILSLKNETPHKIVYEILQGIYRENNSKINDDMTCIAIKIAQLS